MGVGLLASSALAQSPFRLKVAVVVDDSTRGPVESTVKASLRSLGDIDVVGVAEDPDFRVDVTLACFDCPAHTTYVGSVRLIETLKPGHITVGVLAGAPSTVSADIRSQIIDSVYSRIRSFERPSMEYTVRWGSTGYEQGIKNLVAAFDQKCFEQRRMYARAFAAKTAAETNAILAEVRTKEWLC